MRALALALPLAALCACAYGAPAAEDGAEAGARQVAVYSPCTEQPEGGAPEAYTAPSPIPGGGAAGARRPGRAGTPQQR